MTTDDTGRVVLFGGQGRAPFGRMLGDLWAYSGRSWRQLRPGGRGPQPRCAHGLAPDGGGGLVVFGGVGAGGEPLGDTWVFDGQTWHRMAGRGPPARMYLALAYDPDLGGCVLHGGTEGDGPAGRFRDTWLFRRGRWEWLGDGFDTDPRDDHELAYHPAAGRLVMLDGLGGRRGMLVRGPAGWEQADLEPLHLRHQCTPLTWDPGLNGLVLHGGETGQGGRQFDATLVLRDRSKSRVRPPFCKGFWGLLEQSLRMV